jgi:hypothetical protein
MNVKIYYFTGTGNSLYAGKMLSSNLNGVLVPIMIQKEGDGKCHESLGFIFPVYYLDIPDIVRDVIVSMDLSGENLLMNERNTSPCNNSIVLIDYAVINYDCPRLCQKIKLYGILN